MTLKEFLENINNPDICGIWVYIVNDGEYCLDDDYLDEFKGLLDREVNDFEQEDTNYYWVWLKDI